MTQYSINFTRKAQFWSVTKSACSTVINGYDSNPSGFVEERIEHPQWITLNHKIPKAKKKLPLTLGDGLSYTSDIASVRINATPLLNDEYNIVPAASIFYAFLLAQFRSMLTINYSNIIMHLIKSKNYERLKATYFLV